MCACVYVHVHACVCISVLGLKKGGMEDGRVEFGSERKRYKEGARGGV